MKTIGLFDAKTRLSEICREVAENGDEFTITRRGRVMARLVPAESARASNPYLELGIREALAAWDQQWGKLGGDEKDFPDVWRRRRGSKPSPFDSPKK